MNKDIKEDWIEALRSGEYEQGFNSLDRKDRQCCLGVLCDLLDVEWYVFNAPMQARCYGSGVTAGSALPPHIVRAAASLSEADVLRVAALNDKYRCNFDEIADWIEVYL